MFDFVIRFSLRHRAVVVLASVAALGYGAYLATTLPIDVFPDLDRPRVVILSECPGMASEEIETLVTQPIESAVLGATGVEAVRSQSSLGLSVIYVEFDWSSEVRAARQVVQERLATVMTLMPPGVRPVMTPPTSIMGQIMHLGISRRAGPNGGTLAVLGTSGLVAERTERAASPSVLVWRVVDRNDPATWRPVTVQSVAWQSATGSAADSTSTSRDLATRNEHQATRGDTSATVVTAEGRWNVTFPSPLAQQMELRTLADWVVRPRLLKVSGIAEILLLGGERKQYQVLVNPHALVEYDVSLKQVEDALAANNLSASGGFTLEGQAERPVRVIGRLGPLPQQVVRDLAKVPVRLAGARSVLVEHVAQVTEAPPPKRGDASIDGRPGVVVTVVKQPHVDTRALTARVHAALDDLESSLPADIVIDRQLFQLENFIDRGIYYVAEALVIGALLVVIVLVMFLLNVRTTFITLTAIPLSLAVTAIAFKWMGLLTGRAMSINVMTLGGLAVAMGELVDDAIVDVENIFRRLRENRALAAPRSALRVVFEASREIRSAIVFGTAVVILVFLPLFAMSGVEGRLFTPLGIAYIISILASLLVSLTVTPALSSYLLPNSRAVHREGDGLLLRQLKWAAGHLIRLSLRRGGTILLVCWLAVAAAAWTMTRLGADFLPAFDEGSVQLNVALPAGSSLEASNETAAIIDATLERLRASKSNPRRPILHFVRRTGRDLRDEHAQPVTNSEYLLNMNPESPLSRDAALHLLLDDLGQQLPGVDLEAEQPLAHLISHMLSGVTAQVAIKIFGDDLDTLQRVAREIKSEIAGVPGITEPVIESQSYVDELHIVLRADDLAFYGLSRADVAGVVQTALQGEIVSQVLEGQRRFDLVVKLDDAARTDYANLQNLRIDLPSGGRIALSQVADIPGGTVGPNQVSRENVRRRLVIRVNSRDRDLAGVVADIQQRVRDRVQLPQGYFVEYGGQFESQRSATMLIGALTVLAVVGMFAVLMMLWPSPRIVLQILNAIPTAFVGGVLALVLTGQSLSVASLVGFVSLGGIAVRNGILLVSHYFHLLREEGESFDEHMILRGSLERLAPVLMTALTAGIALLPIVLGGHKPGLEILYPVATVITGGLLTSTLCEFLVHPGLFWKFSGRDAAHLAQGGEVEVV